MCTHAGIPSGDRELNQPQPQPPSRRSRPYLPAVVRAQRLQRLVAAAPDVLGAVIEPLQYIYFFVYFFGRRHILIWRALMLLTFPYLASLMLAMESVEPS
jgi:hypothetical protein